MTLHLFYRLPLRLTVVLCAALSGTAAHATTVDDLLARYRSQGAQSFSTERAQQQWTQEILDPKTQESRSCITCHGRDLKKSGKHATTGKIIEPMAPSVNSQRLTDAKHIEKWFKRNCIWVLNRECTAQEKGDFLTFLQQQ